MFCVIIPAYKPDEGLLKLVERFKDDKDVGILVVDDGSGEDFLPIFDALPEGVALLRHEVNRGKGAALKTAINAILNDLPDCALAVTADADGQHTYEDIHRIAEAAAANPDGLTLGCRAFTGKVPPRSIMGNVITRGVFAVVGGCYVSDTQTGLRAFGREAMKRFAKVPGDRYEYEINMLLDAANSGMPIREVPIETIYIADNASSHFDPVKDSIKIYRCIFRSAMPRMLTFLAELILLALITMNGSGLFVACLVAELVGGLLDIVLGGKHVPKTVGTGIRVFGRFMLRYAVLCGLHTALGLPIILAKLVDGALELMRGYVGK